MSWFYRDGMAFGYALPTFIGGIPGWTFDAAANRLAMRFVARQWWNTYGRAAEAHGLVWGGRWKMRDLPHVQWEGDDV